MSSWSVSGENGRPTRVFIWFLMYSALRCLFPLITMSLTIGRLVGDEVGGELPGGGADPEGEVGALDGGGSVVACGVGPRPAGGSIAAGAGKVVGRLVGCGTWVRPTVARDRMIAIASV